MNVSYHFAPIRVLSGAKSNKACRAITQFVKELCDRRSYDINEMDMIHIVKAVQDECTAINAKSKTKGTLSATGIKTGEWDDKRDWVLHVDYKKASGEAIQVLTILAFYTKGAIYDKTLHFASKVIGEPIRKSHEIV